MKASYYTLGCKLNFAETSTIAKMLRERGVMHACENEEPDVCVVNTCSVTDVADKKGRALIRRLVRQHPEAAIIVTGCYAQLKPSEISEIEGVDLVLGTNEKLQLAEYLDAWLKTRSKESIVTPMKQITEFRGSCEKGDRTRWWLKVQDGCDYFCTYCTIPYARGRSRSASVAELVRMAEQAAGQGAKEIVLTGVNIGDFGRGGKESFFDLIRALDDVEGIERYRISSIEPNLLTEEIIDWVASEARAFMPHFHIPLQSGSDEVLRAMNRRYDTALYRERIAHIRSKMPDAFIGVDVIAGARGETTEEWIKSREFIESLDVTRLHVFPYSERPGTAALLLHKHEVERGERHKRVAELTELSDKKWIAFANRLTGHERPVLWESIRGGIMHGLTDNYIRVAAPAVAELINTQTAVRLTGISDTETETMIGSAV